MKDKELIRQLKRGHTECLDCIIENYYDEILKYCMYETRGRETAYDLTQETFLRFIRSADGYEYKNLRAYLYAIARNLCVDDWKALGKKESLEQPEKTEKTGCSRESEARADSPERDAYYEIENKMVLAEYLSKLPQEQREVVVLRYYGELKFSEIADILEINQNTAKTRLRAGIRHLKKMFKE